MPLKYISPAEYTSFAEYTFSAEDTSAAAQILSADGAFSAGEVSTASFASPAERAIPESIMRFEEKAIFTLRSLYRRHGYLPYKMSKFEEYELYSRNREFLVSDRVITFNDTNGRLMALKPDVTLSIIKNGEDLRGVKQKVFYNENVYRVSENTRRFKEILQTGLECIGDIDLFDIYEVITLAAESLALISDDFYIVVSNLDLVSSLLSGICDDPAFISGAVSCLSKKDPHDLEKLCGSFGISEENFRKIRKLISLHGERNDILSGLEETDSLTGTDRPDGPDGTDGPDRSDGLHPEKILQKMRRLSSLLDQSRYSGRIRFDFSLVNDMNYYNGFVFQGFAAGACRSVLAGGQYGNMMRKMNRASEAIGFALYLDRLDGLHRETERYDVDTLLLYGDGDDLSRVAAKVEELTGLGRAVSAQKAVPPKLRYRELIDLRDTESRQESSQKVKRESSEEARQEGSQEARQGNFYSVSGNAPGGEEHA